MRDIQDFRLDRDDIFEPHEMRRYSYHFNWAREGQSSYCLTESRHRDLCFLHMSLKAPGGRVTTDPTSRDALDSLAHSFLAGYVADLLLDDGAALVTMGDLCAVVRLSPETYKERWINTAARAMAFELWDDQKKAGENTKRLENEEREDYLQRITPVFLKIATNQWVDSQPAESDA